MEINKRYNDIDKQVCQSKDNILEKLRAITTCPERRQDNLFFSGMEYPEVLWLTDKSTDLSRLNDIYLVRRLQRYVCGCLVTQEV